MNVAPLKILAIIAVIAVVSPGPWKAGAGDLKLTLPKRSQLTPVQRLNREGVDAIRKRQFEKAEARFYQAYLYDPADPFTLNNLGYIAELHGQLERAEKFYTLAAEQAGDASIDRTTSPQFKGKPIRNVFGSLNKDSMRINAMNVNATQLLSESRTEEAGAVLKQALALDPANVFTLNNMGVATESSGDYRNALIYYTAAADSHSTESAPFNLNRIGRGKSINEIAADSARKVRESIRNADTVPGLAATFTLHGVWATNHNDLRSARYDFFQAYSLDPGSGFSLNNLGYIAERDGDLETAQFFYAKARDAQDANARVGLATQRYAEGKHLSAIAAENDRKVDEEFIEQHKVRRRQASPNQLKHRDTRPELNSNVSLKEPNSSIAQSPLSEPSRSQLQPQ